MGPKWAAPPIFKGKSPGDEVDLLHAIVEVEVHFVRTLVKGEGKF